MRDRILAALLPELMKCNEISWIFDNTREFYFFVVMNVSSRNFDQFLERCFEILCVVQEFIEVWWETKSEAVQNENRQFFPLVWPNSHENQSAMRYCSPVPQLSQASQYVFSIIVLLVIEMSTRGGRVL